MNKQSMIVGAVVLVVVLAVGAFILNSNKNTTDGMMKDEAANTMMKDDKTQGDVMMKDEKTQGDSMMKDEKMMGENESYIPYSSTVLASTAAKKRVLFFFANWCPTCIPTDKEFQASTDKIPADVAVIRVNYQDTDTDQEEKDLAKKYGVTYQHTFVEIDAQGNKVTSWNGGGVDELIAKLQ